MNEPSSVRAAFYWLRDLILSVVIAIVAILFLYQPVKVEGTSMMPTLVDQERIFINKFIYRFGLGEIGRGGDEAVDLDDAPDGARRGRYRHRRRLPRFA